MTTHGNYLRLRGRLPDGRDNGLGSPELATELRHDPHVVYVVALLEPVSVAENLETAAAAVTLGVTAVELVDPEAGRRLLSSAFEARTGIVGLPFEEAPDGVDPSTGEILDTVAAALEEAAADAGVDVKIHRARGGRK